MLSEESCSVKIDAILTLYYMLVCLSYRYSGQSEEVAETAHALALAYSESATAEAESK